MAAAAVVAKHTPTVSSLAGSEVTRVGDDLFEGGPTYSSINNFASIHEIYRGRHSVVWNCVCKRTGGPVVLKAYVKAKMQLRHFQQVKREVDLMKQISLCTCVRFLGTFEDNKNIYIVQENCTKGDLFKRVLRAGGILPERVVVSEVILPMLYTLDFLHSKNVIHRDIKPENIFFAEDGTLRLGDFGLSINMLQERPKSRVGTLDYMAPEVICLPSHDERIRLETNSDFKNIVYYGPKVDVWACGILAYELMVGKPPFEVEEERETALRIMYSNDIDFPCYVSPKAQSFVEMTLMKKPDERPAARDLFKHPWLQPYMDLFLEKFPQAAAVMPVSENRSRAVLLNQRSSLRRTRFSDQPVSDIIPARAELPPIWQDASNGCAAQADRRESMTLPPITPTSDSLENDDRMQPTTKSRLKRNFTLNLMGKKDPAQMTNACTSNPSNCENLPAKEPGPRARFISPEKTHAPPKRNFTAGPNEFDKQVDVVMAVEDMEKFRKLGLGTETQSKASATRPTGIRGRIVSYLQGVHNRSRE